MWHVLELVSKWLTQHWCYLAMNSRRPKALDKKHKLKLPLSEVMLILLYNSIITLYHQTFNVVSKLWKLCSMWHKSYDTKEKVIFVLLRISICFLLNLLFYYYYFICWICLLTVFSYSVFINSITGHSINTLAF